ncbi:MAG: TolC family protein [Gallionella sp.]|nr:TolC family protein [Gallionella sp.]MCK9353951.1 TolC family protein [Gallionella sp.]
MSKQNQPSVRSISSRRLTMLPLTALILATLGGCAITPEPLTGAERKERIQQDMSALFKDVEPLSGPLSLHEAQARALKYNADARLKLMEEALSNAQLDLAHYDMLPRMTMSAGYSSRNNDALSSSVTLNNGVLTPTGTYSGAQERSRTTTNAVLAWNVLDFGVSYVRAQQQATQTLMANERKRKVVQNIMQDVRHAYWRAYGAQNILPRLDALLVQVNDALKRSRSMEEQRLMAPIDALSYQRGLIDLYQQIMRHRQELASAKTELSALINVKPGTKLVLSGDDNMDEFPGAKILNDMDALDQAALANRPELREEDYRKKVTVLEARKALFSLLPGIEINASANHDSNRFLFKNDWTETGATVSFNLLRAFSYSSMKDAQEAQAKLDDARRVALSMAVLAQVRIAGERYREAITDYAINKQAADVDARIEKHVVSGVAANSESDMTLLRAKVKAALSEMQRYVSYAGLQMSYARVASSIGVDMLPDSPKLDDLKSFSDQISRVDEAWQKGDFQQGSSAPQSVATQAAEAQPVVVAQEPQTTESKPVAVQESQPVATAEAPAVQQVAELSVTVKEAR